ETMLVSTCNRVEAYVFGSPATVEGVRSYFASLAGPGTNEALYTRHGPDAVAHLFRVASSLDSMVVGEPQILGQVKDAFGLAQKAGAAGATLTQLCQAAFAAAKRVRTETAIGSAPVSMASAAVELARKIFGELAGKVVLVVGAGEMSEIAARHLASSHARLLMTNRTFERAEALAAECGGQARRFEELPGLLVEADIVISSTASPVPIFTKAMVQAAAKARRYRPLFMVDLAVPRDIDPAVGRLENVYAYDVDDLAQVVAEARENRAGEAQKAEAILQTELLKFLQNRALRTGLPVLGALRTHADEIARAEVERTLAQFGDELTERQRKSIEAMGRAIVNKLLHAPTTRLREAGKAGPEDAAALGAVVAELFGLTPGEPVNEQRTRSG
ncbi:MAG: glutamyl-tRNA reductase, partial [Myxococcales bacterium]